MQTSRFIAAASPFRTGLCAVVLIAAGLGVVPAEAACGGSVQTGYGSSSLALANRCGTTVQDLRIANPGVDMNAPLNGKIIKIPPTSRPKYIPDSIARGAAPASSVLTPLPGSHTPIMPPGRKAAVPRETGNAYTIRKGDTLSAVAGRLALPLDRILAANPGVDPRGLTVGQTINIPTPR